ncbi:hypothetical protein MVES1_003413 [Malassezia vespertilionis]|uniref:RNA helicase n=1 Tax=Malassezia vespertilionis TaxID=2020962 RepID=A0A2N1J7L2_9BASI|nr:uncharacterized protein MVES1_003413 [Malassezia vespertilionis]PKI82452.1 hypothetical protein MVES_003652 [Malassezia vespertilionis]WFD08044.1 hypothetical protein MVES1_003413 [Malassezia vespertilionis]
MLQNVLAQAARQCAVRRGAGSVTGLCRRLVTVQEGGIGDSASAPTFESAGLPTNLCAQLRTTFSNVALPTPTQSALIAALLRPNDVVLRAHTGSGKSFALLLAMLAKPRMLFRHAEQAPTAGISALILVPTNELAEQYRTWARTLVSPEITDSLDPVLQVVTRGGDPASQCATLRSTPPHILVGTPTRISELLRDPATAPLLGIETLATLALDEADAIMQLPGRFPSEKQRWKHLAHRAPGIDILNTVLGMRPTYSGGERQPSAGMERSAPRRGPEKRPPEKVRRIQYRGAARNEYVPAMLRRPGDSPLQLVCMSATANSVLRHFLGARTGWLRTNTRDTVQSARWIDFTGLSQGKRGATVLPYEIEHACLVVDAQEEAREHAEATLLPLRNMTFLPARTDTNGEMPAIVPSYSPDPHTPYMPLLEALAFAFAADGVRQGLALVPPRWSLRKTAAALEALGVPARIIEPGAPTDVPGSVLYLLQSTSARGLDIPALTHVYLLGLDAVQDAVHYTHMAGRVSRISDGSGVRPFGKVVTLLHGKDAEDARVASAEQKMSLLYRRVGIVPNAFDLSLLCALADEQAGHSVHASEA